MGDFVVRLSSLTLQNIKNVKMELFLCLWLMKNHLV